MTLVPLALFLMTLVRLALFLMTLVPLAMVDANGPKCSR